MAQARARETECVEALLAVWSGFERESTESLTHVCVFVEKPLGNFDRDRLCLVCKAQLSGAKFYVVAELRAPLSRSLYRSHVLTTFLGPVLGP